MKNEKSGSRHPEYDLRRIEDFGIYNDTEKIFIEVPSKVWESLEPADNKKISILDFFSGVGDFGMACFQALSDFFEPTLFFIESNTERIKQSVKKYGSTMSSSTSQMRQINSLPIFKATEKFVWVFGDILEMSTTTKFDVITMRFGPKEIPSTMQKVFFDLCHDLLKKNGLILLMDMVAPEHLSEKLNRIHWFKHELGGRHLNGYILTYRELHDFLKRAGCSVLWEKIYHSKITTLDWIKSGQINYSQIDAIHDLIKGAGEELHHEFKVVMRDDGFVDISFPVVFLIAKGMHRNDE